MLNTQQSQYLPTTNKAGFKVMVHPQGSTFFADTSGYRCAPGYEANIGLAYVGETFFSFFCENTYSVTWSPKPEKTKQEKNK